MAKYREREVTAERYKDNHQDEFLIYSPDYKGERVKKSDLIFTDEEKAILVKEDEENYKTSYNVQNTPTIINENSARLEKAAKAVVTKDSEAVKKLKVKAETPNPTTVRPVNPVVGATNKANTNWFNRP